MAEHEKQAVNTAPADVEVGSAEDVEAVMKKYDRESNVRIWTGFPARLVRYGMALFMLTMIWVSMFSTAEGSVRRCFFLGIVLAFVFIMYPIKKNMKLKPNHIPIYDVVLLVVAVGVYFYQIIFKEELIAMGRRIGTPQIIIGIIAILVLVEACRRVVGIPIIIVAAAFVAYTLLPMGADKPLQGTIYNLVYTTNGIIGTPIQVCSTYIFLFVLFGSFLEATGIAAFFIDCANSIAGAATGGPAKVAVISSALCGMVSGSSVGNTVTTGAVTIPLMKRTGYPPRVCRRRRGGRFHRRSDHAPHHGRCGLPDGRDDGYGVRRHPGACDPARRPVLHRYFPDGPLQGQVHRPEGLG